MARIANKYVYILWNKQGTIEYVGKGHGKRMFESCREKSLFGGTIVKRNLSEHEALSMESALIEHYGIDTLKNEKSNGVDPAILYKFPPRTHGTRKKHPLKYAPKTCSKDHYERYKESLKLQNKKQTRKRDLWINTHLNQEFCVYCGESSIEALAFYPNNKEIRALSRKTGLRKELRLRVLEAIQSTIIVCLNCEAKLNNGKILTAVKGASIEQQFPLV